MLRAAARALGEGSPALADPTDPLLPPLHEIRGAARRIARAVGEEAQRQGHAESGGESLEERIDRIFWDPAYE